MAAFCIATYVLVVPDMVRRMIGKVREMDEEMAVSGCCVVISGMVRLALNDNLRSPRSRALSLEDALRIKERLVSGEEKG